MWMVTRVAMYELPNGEFSHAYPSGVHGPLGAPWIHEGWEVSPANGHSVVVTITDKASGEERRWVGKSGDVFWSKDAK